MSRILWNNRVGGLPQVDNARSVPRRPVIWFGEVWLRLPDGSRSARSWRAKQKITRQQAQDVMGAMLASLLEECGENEAVDSGFLLECR